MTALDLNSTLNLRQRADSIGRASDVCDIYALEQSYSRREDFGYV